MGPTANPSMKSDVPPNTALSTGTPYSCEITFAATLNTADENVVVKTSNAKVIVMSHFRQMGRFCGLPLSPGPCHSTRNSLLCNNVTIPSMSGSLASTDMTLVVIFEAPSGAVVAILFAFTAGGLGTCVNNCSCETWGRGRNLRRNNMQVSNLHSVPRQIASGAPGAMTLGPGTGDLEVVFNNPIFLPTYPEW